MSLESRVRALFEKPLWELEDEPLFKSEDDVTATAYGAAVIIRVNGKRRKVLHIKEFEALERQAAREARSMKKAEGVQLDFTRETLTFAQALDRLKVGFRMMRLGWNGKGMFVELQVPDAQSKMTLPYLYMSTVTGDRVPWLPSQTDILAEDWELFRPVEG